ncbi:SfnB family sulfur acquisition oxidoreductase [Paenibacillus anseongense]|uniref:SfnB family sulfur acquisition oxidoreductase n=1 Tax=Paenibacillus anseongense TaxID=2682845 RepID=UPI002DBAC1B2|nr:SfnB family sulfur acquisition oxidoreductase [Paenibacillus anseongense]MEC0266839.1 SfnB family sulfur acquisition oxidoreductase [Paenibacillus anseongense]
MSIKIDALPQPATDIPNAIDLAYELGELPFDLRRRGIPVLRDAGSGRLRIKAGTADELELRMEPASVVLQRLAMKEELQIIGLQQQDRRSVILVHSDSPLRTAADLKGAKLGIAAKINPDDSLRKRNAAKLVDAALQKVGIAAARPKWIELQSEQAADGVHPGRELCALLSKEVDAVYADWALSEESRRLLGIRELEGFSIHTPVLTILTASAGANLILEHSVKVERLLAHISLASDWAIDHRTEAHRLAAKQLGISENAIPFIFSEDLHKQFGVNVSDDKWSRLVNLKKEMQDDGSLQGDFPLEESLDRAILQNAQLLVDSGELERPQRESLSQLAERDLPISFFNERPRAHLLQGDEEALAAARLFAEEIRPGASDRDRGRKLPLREIRRLAELGLLGLVVPKEYGGPDVSTRTLVDIFKIISHADGSIGQIPQNHHFFVKTIELIGSQEQKNFFFREVLNGAQFGNGLAERSSSKGARKITTTVRKLDGEEGFVLNGSKYYTTGALYSHWIPVTALNEDEQRMTAFVPRHARGVTVLDDWSGIGQRTTASGSVVLRNVKVPESCLLPHFQIFEGPQYFSAFGQIMHAAIDIGIARAALEDAAAFVRDYTRPAFGSGVTRANEEPDLIRRFGELGIRLQAAEALLDRAADAIDHARKELNAETAGKAALTVDSAKWLVTETAIEITNALFEVAGTSSMDRKHNYDRHWRNVRIHTLHDPARLKLHHVGKWFLNGVYHEYKM